MTLPLLTDQAPMSSCQMLAGDVKGDAIVDGTDEDNLSLEDGQSLDSDNFRCDLDLDGVI